jgi:hypothetical protein
MGGIMMPHGRGSAIHGDPAPGKRSVLAGETIKSTDPKPARMAAGKETALVGFSRYALPLCPVCIPARKLIFYVLRKKIVVLNKIFVVIS